MQTSAEEIQSHLREVERLREQRSRDPALQAAVTAVKQYQHRRFEQTYSDLLDSPVFAPAARFFLDDLYGPHDFVERDSQFGRIVPALVRLFPTAIVRTVSALAALHALSEDLDSCMATQLASQAIDVGSYGRAWRAVGRQVDREQQIMLMLEIGRALQRYTANPVLRHSLKMMRGPARTAGLGALQSFLETGFDTFRAMKGSGYFLETIAQRERDLANRLFGSN